MLARGRQRASAELVWSWLRAERHMGFLPLPNFLMAMVPEVELTWRPVPRGEEPQSHASSPEGSVHS